MQHPQVAIPQGSAMTRHHVNVAVSAVLGTMAFFAFWWLIADLLLRTMPQLLHSSVEIAFGGLAILVMVISILSGVLVGIQESRPEMPHRHHFRFLHPRLHH